jgi:hypothetical protein
MVAQHTRKPGVYRRAFLIDGRPAFYVIDWHGVESEETIVEEGETEREVIDRLSAALWLVRPRGSAAQVPRPVLRLL